MSYDNNINKGLKICHVCSAHPVDDGRVFRRSCVSLVEAGYEVHLIARSRATTAYIEAGVHIHPLEPCSSQFRRISRRSIVANLAAQLEPDLYHVHEPELLGATIAIAGTKPVIYDVHESYLNILMDRDWIPKPLRPFMRMAWDLRERALLKHCAAVVPVTDEVASRYNKLHHRVEIIANYPELDEIISIPCNSRDGKTCVFVGTLNRNRGILEAISAIGLLSKRGLRVPLIIAGDGDSRFIQAMVLHAKAEGVGDLVTYKGVLPRNEAVKLASTGSIGLVPHLPYGNNMAAWPVKMMEFMALGLPIVYSDLPSHQKIAGGRNLGIAVDPKYPEQIANAIEDIITNADIAQQMGCAGRLAAIEVYNWTSQKVKLLNLYSELLGGR